MRLFMGRTETGVAVVSAPLAINLREVVNVFLCQPAAVIDGGNLCRQRGVSGVLAAALFVAGLCGLALGVCAGMTFHGWILWVELTGNVTGATIDEDDSSTLV